MADPPASEAKVAPAVALSLLEALQEADAPAEQLFGENEEDLPLAFRRRLGLSSVIEDQARRYRSLRDGRDALPAAELASLFALVARRPDARHLFADAGRRLARRRLAGRRLRRRLAARALPESVRRRLALRRIRRLVGELSPASEVSTEGAPPVLLVRDCLPARATGCDDGCAAVEGLVAEVAERYGTARLSVDHPRCEGRGAELCEWRLEPAEGTGT